MKGIETGDIVTRKSYGGDIYFRVDSIEGGCENRTAVLRGLFYRLYADAPLDDLEKKNPVEVNTCRKENMKVQSRKIMQLINR
jgi:spore coat assembly protein